MKHIFWLLAFAVFYTYAGYAILLILFTLFKKKDEAPAVPENSEWPEVCLFITAYNEKSILKNKVENCFAIDYPSEKLKVVFVTDGSNDGSYEFLNNIQGITVYHEPERRGKIHAMNRGMQFITSPIVVFTDANTSLNSEAVKFIVSQFSNPKVGCVAGRKKVISTQESTASETGEGLYLSLIHI